MIAHFVRILISKTFFYLIRGSKISSNKFLGRKTFLTLKYEQNELSYIKIHQQIKKLEFLSNCRKRKSKWRGLKLWSPGCKIFRINFEAKLKPKLPSQLYFELNAMKNKRLAKWMNFPGILWFSQFFMLTLMHKRWNNFFIQLCIWFFGLYMKSTQIFQHIIVLFDAI